MKATILNNMWDINLPEPGAEPWFLDWVLKSPRQAGDHLACGFKAIESLLDIYEADDIRVAWEPFGGIGAQARMIEYCFNTKNDHVVADFNMQAVEHLTRTLPIELNVEHADAYSNEVYEADLISLDFGDLTVWKAQPDKKQGKLLDAVFAETPKAVVLTDIACRYLHLHQKSYEPILGEGCCSSYEVYLSRFANHLQDRYGYVMHEAHYTRWSAVMAFVPEDLADPIHSGRIYKLPTDTEGLKLE